ncbi:MAG TPA: lysylphosphatidylglycerol synthase transmembrane domain-containing protein [Nitrospiraceae bacterium]
MSDEPLALSALADAGKAGRLRRPVSFGAYGAPLTGWVLAGGVLVFALLLWKTGLDAVGQLLWNASWAFPLVFIPYALVMFCESMGWWFAFPSTRSMVFKDLMRLTLAAKGVQFLTPSIIQAGEFMKIHLLRESGVKSDVAAASVVVAKTTTMIAELLFIGAGLCLAWWYVVAVDPAVAASIMLGLGFMCLFMVGAILVQRAGLFRPLLWVSQHFPFLAGVITRHEGFLSSTQRIIQEHLVEKQRFAWSCACFFMGWAAGIVEAWVFLSILGLPTSVGSALFIQVWSVIVSRLTTFIPANLGAHEAGVVMTFSVLGLSVEGAMAFALLRRIRQLGWIAASLGCLKTLLRG